MKLPFISWWQERIQAGAHLWGMCSQELQNEVPWPMCPAYLQLGNGVGDDCFALFDYQIGSQYWYRWHNHQIGLSNTLIPTVEENKGDLRACFLAWASVTSGHSKSWRVMTAACEGPLVPVLMGHWQLVLKAMQDFGFIPSTHWPSEISWTDSWLPAQSSRGLCPP